MQTGSSPGRSVAIDAVGRPVVVVAEEVDVAVVGVVDEDNDVVNGGGAVSDDLLVEDA